MCCARLGKLTKIDCPYSGSCPDIERMLGIIGDRGKKQLVM